MYIFKQIRYRNNWTSGRTVHRYTDQEFCTKYEL